MTACKEWELPMSKHEKKINVKFPENLHAGTYSNMMAVSHSREEFIMDFVMLTPPQGTVTARIICSPGHMKRIVSTLQDNLKKYEAIHGIVQAADEPQGQVGFTKQ
jgi:hypothetical protein